MVFPMFFNGNNVFPLGLHSFSGGCKNPISKPQKYLKTHKPLKFLKHPKYLNSFKSLNS